MSKPEFLSTSALAKQLGMSSKELFSKFTKNQLIEKLDGQWCLTNLGAKIGGEYKESKQYGRYIVWSASMANTPTIEKQAGTRLTARALGLKFDLSAQR